MPSAPPPERELVSCNLCGADDHVLWARVGEATLVRCRECGLVFTNPRLPTAVLTDSYEEDYGAQHEDPVLLAQRRRMYELEARGVLRHAGGGRFLDVGCGTGEFLALMRDHFEVYGVEVSRRYVQLAREQYALPHLCCGELTAAQFDADTFDVVQMRGVLQHLPDPLAAVREAFRVTRPGGLLVLNAMPNIASPAARAILPPLARAGVFLASAAVVPGAADRARHERHPVARVLR
jgi:SAM-dependent methyltransferase